jgi:hypothetical protein
MGRFQMFGMYSIRDGNGECIASGSQEACRAAARLFFATVPAVVRQCQAGDVVRATFSAGLIQNGRKYRIRRMRAENVAVFCGLEPCPCELVGFDYVPPADDPGLPSGYSELALPPGWITREVNHAKHGIGYVRTLGVRDGQTLYQQSSCGWAWSGSPWVADDGASMHEAMRIALGLDWIGELWTDPEAFGRPWP